MGRWRAHPGYGASVLSLVAVFLGVVLRLLYLDADPYYYEWRGYIADEGRWVQNARSLALHGNFFEPALTHFLVAPLFQVANYLSFVLGGVSIWTARIFTAVCGSVTLVLFWTTLRHSTTSAALLLGVCLLAFQPDLLMLSRVAVPETVLMTIQLAIYLTLVSDGPSGRRMLLAGGLLAVGIGLKLTMVLFLPVFSALIWILPRGAGEGWNTSTKMRELCIFWASCVLPLSVAGFLSIGFGYVGVSGLSAFGEVVSLKLNWTSTISKVRFLVTDPFAATLNVWALWIWLALLTLMAAGPRIVEGRAYP